MSRQPEKPSPTFEFALPSGALDALLTQLKPVGTETIALTNATGRVLAEPIVADRDSPACDVSQMDGYAVRLRDLDQPALEVAGEVMIGQAPPMLPEGKTLRIYTGAPVPDGAEAVIKREDVDEQPERIGLETTPKPAAGRFIRRRGENLRGGEEVLAAGSLITPAVMSALASFGVARPRVHARVRVGVIVTGSELVSVDGQPDPWQLRDSNGPALSALLSACSWVEVESHVRVVDDFDRLQAALADRLERCDGVLLTGGVSMGDYDHVPAVAASVGARTVFHKLPIRPGKPVLGAVGPKGQAILGLPGNPVSVMVTARRLAAPILRHLGGMIDAVWPAPVVTLSNFDGKTLGLSWSRPVRIIGPGRAELVPGRGSGDMVSTARSDGFVEIPPGASGEGPWPFYRWEL